MSTEPELFPPLPPIVRECIALRDLADWAETLLCKSETPEEYLPSEWELLVKQWCDKKRAMRYKSTEEILAERAAQAGRQSTEDAP